jgi:AraC-like DNA-binding protein
LNVRMKQEANGIIYKIGINASQPVTKTGDFFSEAIKLTHGLSTTVQDNQILTSSLVKRLCRDKTLFANQNQIRSLSQSDEEFINQLLGITEANLSELQFDLDNLSNAICISRPQLYRKVKALTGRSPNDFLQHFRMYKALSLLKQRKLNVAEIAFETGFNSPSYFTKCFTEKFGCKPSLFTKSNVT